MTSKYVVKDKWHQEHLQADMLWDNLEIILMSSDVIYGNAGVIEDTWKKLQCAQHTPY